MPTLDTNTRRIEVYPVPTVPRVNLDIAGGRGGDVCTDLSIEQARQLADLLVKTAAEAEAEFALPGDFKAGDRVYIADRDCLGTVDPTVQVIHRTKFVPVRDESSSTNGGWYPQSLTLIRKASS